MDLLKDISESSTLWRYMDLSKFLDILINKKLVFPRYDMFEDPFEGFSPHFVELARQKLIELGEFDDNVIDIVVDVFSSAIMISNYYAYVSCWHINEYESAGMWKLYCNGSESLVIKTTAERLKNSLVKDKNYKLITSKVNYDYKLSNSNIADLTSVDPFNSLLTKRESFEHEKEYRLLLIDQKEKEKREGIIEDYHQKMEEKINNIVEEVRKGKEQVYESDTELLKNILNELKDKRAKILSLDIEPNILVEEIIVSPYAPSWFVDTLKKLVKQIGYDFKVTQSKLYQLK